VWGTLCLFVDYLNSPLNIEWGQINPKATRGCNIDSGQIDPKATQGLNNYACVHWGLTGTQVQFSHLGSVGLKIQMFYSQRSYLTWPRWHFTVVRSHDRSLLWLLQGNHLRLLLLFPLNAVVLNFFVGSCSVWHKYNRLACASRQWLVRGGDGL